MGYYCTVPQCTSLAGKTKNVKFHRFPRDVSMADKWNLILKRGKPYTKYSKVCSLHFTQADYNVTTMGQWKTLSKDAVPSQNLPRLNPDGSVMVIRKSRTVKYKDAPPRKDDPSTDKCERWSSAGEVQHAAHPAHPALAAHAPHPPHAAHASHDLHDSLAYRLQTLSAIASHIAPQPAGAPHKQDATMQTDPLLAEDEDAHASQPTSDTSETSYTSEHLDSFYGKLPAYAPAAPAAPVAPADDDYLPQTNEEYNSGAERYALERKCRGAFEPQVVAVEFAAQLAGGFAPASYAPYPHPAHDAQGFFADGHIKQEVDMGVEDDKFLYDGTKDQLEASDAGPGAGAGVGLGAARAQQRLVEQLQHQLKQEPDAAGYYEGARPGPELLIAKQNALAAHTQLWQNSMKRPFFYSEAAPGAPLHRYEDITRILQ